MKYFLSFFLLLLTTQALATPATDLNNLLTTMKTLRAAYVQTTVDPKFKDKKVVEGTALLERPNQFRWEVEKPYQQLLIADGKKLWIYDADLEQVTVQPLQDNLKDTPALLLAGDPKAITEHFKVHSEDTGFAEQTFNLIPLDDGSLVRDVKLTFKGSVISRMVLIDNLHQVVTIEFSQIKINETLPQDLFRFTPPSGVDVIGGDVP
jgi:outer membrane lipoprotein carrier protein